MARKDLQTQQAHEIVDDPASEWTQGGLTPREALFVEHYVGRAKFSASKAYELAGYTVPESYGTLGSLASRLANKPTIQAAIKERVGYAIKAARVSLDQIIAETARDAFYDPAEVVLWGPNGVTPRDASELTPDQRKLVTEITETVNASGGKVTVKLADRHKAREFLAKLLGMVGPETPQTPQEPQAISVYLEKAHGFQPKTEKRLSDVVEIDLIEHRAVPLEKTEKAMFDGGKRA